MNRYIFFIILIIIAFCLYKNETFRNLIQIKLKDNFFYLQEFLPRYEYLNKGFFEQVRFNDFEKLQQKKLEEHY